MSTQKTPLSRTLNLFAQKKAFDEIEKRGKALPGIVESVAGAIITVDFQVSGVTLPKVAMPLFGPEYIRYPIQKGDKGVAFPADVYLGGMSGLGGGTADTTLRGNLSTLVWFPVANKAWTAPPGSDANTLAMYGKAALLLLDSIANHGSVKLTASNIVITFGTATITLNSSSITLAKGSSSIVIDSSGVKIMGKDFLTHAHLGVQTGVGTSGPVA